MLQIEIKHSSIVDIKIFFQTLKNKKWLDKRGYYYYLFERKCFRKNDFKMISQDIEEELLKYNCRMKDLVQPSEKYLIFLTKFGTFGSYELPNKIFVNVHRNISEIAETIVHEIVHLKFEDEVQKRNLSHEQKERMVDGVVEKILKGVE